MLRIVAAAAALGLLAANPAAAATGSGTISWTFTSFTGPFGAAAPANLGDQSQWLLVGSVNGQTPTVNGNNVLSDGFYYVGGTTGLNSGSVDMVYANVPTALDNIVSFTPAAGGFTNVQDHTPFLLGTLSFTNGQWVGGTGDPATNYPTVLDFTLQTTSGDQPAFNQTLHDSITMVTNQAANGDVDCATNQQTREDEADFIYITGATQLGSMRVYDAACAPPGVPNHGSVEVWAQFGSIDLLQFRNPTDGAFVSDSVSTGSLGGGVPEPGAWALMIAGFGLSGLALRRRSGRAVPADA